MNVELFLAAIAAFIAGYVHGRLKERTIAQAAFINAQRRIELDEVAALKDIMNKQDDPFLTLEVFDD